jgi:hypothetical protein
VATKPNQVPRKIEQAVAALLQHATIALAAEALGISERSLRTWMARDDFRKAYQAARRQLLDDAVKVLQRASVTAVATLIKQLNAPRPADAIKAADSILGWTFKGHELLDLEGRLAALEEGATGRKGQ